MGALPRRELTWTAALLLLGLGLRLAEPTRLVMIFSAYEWTDEVARFTSLGRYGASTSVLYRLLFAAVPPDHLAIVALHRVAGALTLPVMAALLARCTPPPWSVPLFAAMLALLPLGVRDHATESILVPIALWLSSGLLLLDTALAAAAPRISAAGALVLLALAMSGRPEMLVVAPLLAAALVLARRGGQGWPWLVFGGALLAVLALPQLLHVLARQAQLSAQGAVTPVGQGLVRALLERGPSSHIAAHPELWPAAVPVLALASLRHPPGRRVRLAVLGISAVWVAALLVDLPTTSIARLQAPVAAMLTALAAWGWAAELQGRRPKLWLIAGAAALLWTALPSHRFLRRPTNEDQTEAVWRRTLPQLPPTGACVVVLTAGDPPDPGKVQRAVPAYLLRPPHRDVRLVPMRRWLEDPPSCAAGAYALVDHRCYAVYHRPPGQAPLLPSCAAVLQRALPVDVWTERNWGDNEYGYFGDVQRFEVGLYRLAPATSP